MTQSGRRLRSSIQRQFYVSGILSSDRFENQLMLLRRFTKHLTSQNWVAVALDLIVVAVGVFIAFQVERWYEQKRLESTESAHLVALAEDFALIREDLEWNIERQKRSTQATLALLEERARVPIQLSHDRFYSLLDEALLGVAFSDVSRAYDVLIATGEIRALRDESLKSALADFYGEAKQGVDWQQKEERKIQTIEPYIIRNLDHVALMRKSHPETTDTSSMVSTRQLNSFEDAIKTDEFEAVIVAVWHASYETIGGSEYLLERVTNIEALLKKNLEIGAISRETE